MKPAHQLLLLVTFLVACIFWPLPQPEVYATREEVLDAIREIDAMCTTDTDCGCTDDCLETAKR